MLKYYSDVTKQVYDTEEALLAAEEAENVKLKELEEKKAKKKERAEEVENAFKEVHEAQVRADKLLKDFCKDYGAFHTSVTEFNPFSLFDLMFKW